MGIIVKKYIGDNGVVLLPINQNATNSANLISADGVYYKVVEERSYEEGNSLGLLLALTYTQYVEPEPPATPLQGNPLGLLLTLTYSEDI